MNRGRRQLLVLLDYDGTLTPIAARPEQASLAAATRRALQRLNRCPGVQVAVISGRALRDVKRLVRIKRLWYAGNHGLELQAGRRCWVHPAARRRQPQLRQVVQQLRRAMRSIPGAWVENKGVTCSVHWRAVPAAQQRLFQRRIQEALAPALRRGALRRRLGKRVVEVRPAVACDKGTAVGWFARHLGGAPALLYVGDDRTDEDAFRAVNRARGWTVFVGPSQHPTAARYRVSSPASVRRWLEALWRALA